MKWIAERRGENARWGRVKSHRETSEDLNEYRRVVEVLDGSITPCAQRTWRRREHYVAGGDKVENGG